MPATRRVAISGNTISTREALTRARVETLAMSQPVARAVVDAFYKAYTERNVETIAEYLDDAVEWTISGPVDLLGFCGTHRGKAAVLDLIGRLVPGIIRVTTIVPDTMLVDGDTVATLNRLWGKRADDGRVISYRLAHFLRFSNGKVIRNLTLIDSFDAVEQVLGHPIDVHHGPLAHGDLIAV